MSLSKPSHLVIVSMLLGVLALAGCGPKEATEQQAPPPPAVTVVTLKPEEVVLKRELPGRVNASLIAEVRPQVSGIVKRRLFTEGGTVKAGQVLYQLDDASYQAEQARAKATLARAQATLKSAELNAKRSAELVKIDAVSQQDNENAVAALNQAKADVASAEAALRSANVTLGYARITSPISGRIGKSSVTQGALVTANQAAALAVVQRLDPVYVDLTQSSSELLRLRKEMEGSSGKSADLPVQILLEDGSTYKQQGKLTFTDVTVDPTTGSFLLRVTVPNPDNMLLPGMYVRAVVGSGVRENALLVPQQGISRDPKGNANAMVVNQEGKVEPRAVQVSRTIGDKWLVDGGLVAGDRVIVEGLQKIAPGAPVRLTEATPGNKANAPATAASNSETKPETKSESKPESKPESAATQP